MPSMSLTCRICNLPMQKSRTSKPQGEAAHNHCRAGVAWRPHGVSGGHGHGGYKRGCRCEVCREAKNSTQRRFGRRRLAETGEWPRGRWIKTADRLAIYERDSWTCQICDLPTMTEWVNGNHASPTLDHIIPQSHGGSHSPENLRTAHALCNAIRTDRTEMTNDEIAALARGRLTVAA